MGVPIYYNEYDEDDDEVRQQCEHDEVGVLIYSSEYGKVDNDGPVYPYILGIFCTS